MKFLANVPFCRVGLKVSDYPSILTTRKPETCCAVVYSRKARFLTLDHSEFWEFGNRESSVSHRKSLFLAHKRPREFTQVSV